MMTKRLFIRRCFILLLVATLLSSGMAVFAQQDAEGQQLRLNFADVPDGNWAQKHVSKLALLDITQGYVDGTYRPNNDITQQEVIAMVIRLMGHTDLEDNIAATQPNHIINFLNTNVSDWARPAVAKAFDLGVLDYNFELDMNRNVTWGTKFATREWVAKLIIQAIGQDELASELANTNSIFTDNLDISAWALGYVNAASQLNIVTGSSSGNFNPGNRVTRAELAAFLSRGENLMAERSELVKVGTLVEFSLRDIKLMNDEGETETFQLHRDQKFYSYTEPNNAISSTQVKQYTRVAVIAHEGIAYYVEVIDDEEQLVTMEGILLDIPRVGAEVIEVEVDGINRTFELHSFVKVLNEQNAGLPLRDLVKGSTVQLKFDTVIGNTITFNSEVIEIKVLKAPLNKTASGYIDAVNVEESNITITDAGTGDEGTYAVAADVDIKVGTRTLKLEELAAGDEINYEVVNSFVTSIEITNAANPYIEVAQGTIKSYDPSSGYIMIEDAEGTPSVRRFASNVTVALSGHNLPTIKELENNDIVRIHINSFDEVTYVEVLNREIKRMIQVEIVSYHEPSSSLFVILDGRGSSFEISDETVIVYGDQQFNIDKFDFSRHFVEGKKVDMTFTNDKLMEVKLSNYYEGVVKEVDATKRTLTLAMDSIDQKFTLPTYTVIETYKASSTTLNDLNVGDTIRINLNADQTQVSHIQVKQSVLFRVVSTQLSSRVVTATDQAGQEFKLFVYANTPLTHYDKRNPSFTDIKENDALVVNYTGITINSIEVSEAAVGVVKSVNPLSQSLSVTTYNGESRELKWSNVPQVFDGATNRLLGLNALRVGDRVQLVVDPQRQAFVTTLEVREKQFWKYEEKSNTVFYRNETKGFVLAQDAYITENGQPVPVTHFVGKGWPQVKFYMLNGIVYEIERE